MSKYGNVVYGGGNYGELPLLSYSVKPMSIEVLDFGKVHVFWKQPTGNFSRFRLLRNQSGFPETAEDGVVLYEQVSADGSSLAGNVAINSFTDDNSLNETIPIVEGRQVYYSIFLYTSEKFWVNGGYVTDIVPSNTGATDKMLNLLPRVLVSEQLSPLGTISPDSDIYNFFSGFAFTYEQLLTDIELIRPEHIFDKSTYATIPGEDLNYGLEIEPTLPVINQRRLIREALYLYSKRGVKTGIEDYAESLTGYAPIASVSPNLFLSVQDSTFYGSIGNWTTTSATLTSATEMATATGTNVIDNIYTGKVITTNSSGVISLGNSTPITKGIPVQPSTQYTFSFQVKRPTGSGTVTPTIKFYDKDGTLVSTTAGTGVASSSSWQQGTETITSDATASYAGISFAFSSSGTYYLDMLCFQLGSTVTYDEARAITLLLYPKKINYIHNPSFETDASTWGLTGTTFSTDTSIPIAGYPRTHSGKFVAGGAWSITTDYEMAVEPGTYVTISTYVKSATLTSMEMYVDLYDVDDNLLTTFSKTADVSSSWTRVELSGLVESSSLASYAKVRFAGTAGTIYLDMVQFEDAYKASDYFDGSMPIQFGAIWEGTHEASNTLLYPNRAIKMSRLANTLNSWVPANSFWRITTPAGLEYTNLDV